MTTDTRRIPVRRDEHMVIYKHALSTVLLMAMLVLQGCAFGKQLQTQTADPKIISGTYDLYLYGCRYPEDYEHAAFLISPEAKYPVSLFVLDTSYKVKKGLEAEKALTEAEAFVRCGNHTVSETRVHSIPDDSGGIIGYEILPRYPVTESSGIDPLLVSYSLKDGKIIVYIRLAPEVERSLNQMTAPGGAAPGGGGRGVRP
jgi:hypothetical protein